MGSAIEIATGTARHAEAIYGLALTMAQRRNGSIWAGPCSATFRPQRRVIGVLRPYPTFNRAEYPHQVTAMCCNLHQLVGVGRVGDDDLTTVHAIWKRAERLQALERFGALRARPHATWPLSAGHVPRAQ